LFGLVFVILVLVGFVFVLFVSVVCGFVFVCCSVVSCRFVSVSCVVLSFVFEFVHVVLSSVVRCVFGISVSFCIRRLHFVQGNQDLCPWGRDRETDPALGGFRSFRFLQRKIIA